MTCWIPPIWTPTRSPSRSFEKLFACGPNISLDRFKGKFTVTPIFHGKKTWFPRDFPTNPVNIAKINMKIFGTSSSSGAFKKFVELNQQPEVFAELSFSLLLLDPHEMMKMMSRQFLQKAPKGPPEKRGVFHMKYSP
jgi:hypothetical protein